MSDSHAPEPVLWEPSPRRVRVFFNRRPLADSRSVMLLREPGRVPVYYFPRGDVATDRLAPGDREASGPLGSGRFWHVTDGERHAPNAAFSYGDPPAGAPDLSGHLGFVWDAMDAWYEEAERVYVHARDPRKRVDVLDSTRHVRIELAGEMLAESRRPRLLFETGLPTRYYLPADDVRRELLEPAETRTRCPYKGEAEYYAVRIGETLHRDLVWWYRYPLPECAKIAGLLCFFNEKVDLTEDGVRLERPRSPWS